MKDDTIAKKIATLQARLDKQKKIDEAKKTLLTARENLKKLRSKK